MANTWLLGFVCVIFGILVSEAGTGDPYANQARIVVQNGNLVLQSANNKNISLSPQGQGTIVVNGVDVGRNVGRNVPVGGTAEGTLVDLLRRVNSQAFRIIDLTDQMNQLEENITSISNKVNRFIGTGQDTISNRALRRVMSKVKSLGDKVNTLTQLLTQNECNSNPCRNGGTCVDTYNGFICNCPSNWEGTTCDIDVNECARFAGTSLGCQNGAACVNTNGGYSCTCQTNWHGIHCTEKFDDCGTASHQELCGHGTCIDEKRAVPGQPKYRCICDPGWQKSSSSPACTEDIDECRGPNPRCSRNPPVSCINLPGTFHCGHCPAGYTGNGHTCSDINECETQNGGCSMQPYVQCSNTVGSRTCGPCPAGYVGNGVQCTFLGVCSINRGGCHPLASCIENSAITGTYRECRCPDGYLGSGQGLTGCVRAAGMTCASNPCQHGTCQVIGESFHCVCNRGYHGTLCDREEIHVCFSNPCQNGGTCVRQGQTFVCECPETYEGPTCAERRSTSSCGAYLSGSNGTLQFPENGMRYEHLKSCAWIITVDPEKVVTITFDHFSLEHGANCEFDFLQLNDGRSAGSRVIGRFCSDDLHLRSFVSTHNELYLWFQSDKSIASTGFSLNWTAEDPVCGGVLNVSDYGAVNSPGYPGVYPRNRTCMWLVRVPVGKRIQFHFATLKMEDHPNCSFDFLKIYDGASDRDAVIGTYCTTVTPPPLTTSGHSALLYFRSDNSVQDTGFHITFSSQSSVQGCGGVLTNPKGTVNSPNFPDVYENNLNCEWLIRIHPDNRLLLTFKEFLLESHTNCAFDHVEVYAGANDAAPLLGRYCGTTIPPDLFSNTHQLFIRFKSDNSLVHSGFKAEYKTICGGVFTELTGVLSSPYYPDNYPASAQCIYDVRLQQGYLVSVTFHNMQIEEHQDCRFDYLQVRDGDSEESPLVGRFCGSNAIENIVSTYNFLWLKFETDGSVQNLGFYATYEAIEVGCGGVLTDVRGRISSPLHPDRYPHSIVCSWYLKAPQGSVVRITFTSFNLEPDKDCRFDYVTVQDADGTQVGRFCGNQKPPILTSMDSTMFVKFVADASVAREGFTANYEYLNAMEACGGTFYQESGVIRSPGFPDRYPHNAHCVWVLKGRNQRQISINATNFQLEDHLNCRYDFLEIRNGGYETSPLVGKYCGSKILTTIKSHSNVMRLEFKTDGSMSAPGFEIYFDSTATGCGGKLTSPSGTIVSPNYPQSYPLNADCEWLIQVSAGSIISLSFIAIDIEEHRDCRFDYVQIFDGSSENSKSLLRICNNQQNPGAIVSSGNSLLVRFRSDFSEEAGGFHLAYQTLCNNRLKGMRSGVIESPNFPNSYPHNHNCSWTIEVPNGNNISIAFSHLFMEGGESCDADYVEVIEVIQTPNLEESYQQMGKYCGNLNTVPPTALETSSNVAIVRLVTDRSVTREGFRLEWRTKGCGGDIVDKPNGIIQSPNYPYGYPHKTTCYWHISYPPGSQVVLTVTGLDLENAPECRYDYLRVYGGEDEESPRLLNLCSTISQPQVITSHGNQMMVKFNSDSTVNRKGFMATFAGGRSGCGGMFKTAESTLMSPNFPAPYNPDDECNWLINVDDTRLVVLEFYDFELPVSVNCTMGYLAIHDGYHSNSPLLMKLCGSSKPEGSIYSTGSQMLLRLVADGTNVGKGFRAHYHTGCGQRLLADNGGVITSLNYPHPSLTASNCSWIIYASEPGEKVSLIVTHMNLPSYENCTYSSLTFFDGDMPDSPVISQHCGQKSPPPVMSRGSVLHVFLLNYGVFRATYGMASTHCGGDFSSVEGSFGSPGYPNNYDRDAECVWTVQASFGNKVHLSFESFNLEDSDHCNKDYLEIHENDVTGPLIGRYCGNRLPSNVTSARKLWMKFRSDEIETQTGFLAHYELQHGNVLNGTGGFIASPGYPVHYSLSGRNAYTWTVIAPSEMFISIQFLEMNMMSTDEYQRCPVTRVEIHDGFDENAPLLEQFCGFQIPEPVISVGNVIYIKYLSSDYYPGSFLLQWTAVTENGIVIENPDPSTGDICWEEITLNVSESMTFNSPNYPLFYPPELNCTYIVRAPHFQHVELSIPLLETEDFAPACSFDRLEVYYMSNPYVDNWQLNNTFCGSLNNTFLSSPTNLMKLVFITDKFVSFKGFQAEAKSNCGVHFTNANGVVKSEYMYSDLSRASRLQTFQCEYFITVRPRRTVHLIFYKFNVPSDSICSTNYIIIRNGGSSSSPLVGKYCGSIPPPIFETSSNEVYVQVVVASISAGTPDFELRYTEVSYGCGGRLFLTEDTRYVEVASPNYPNPPVHDTECEWVIVSPSGTRMRMDFESEFRMSPNCVQGDNPEFLEIHDGGTELSPPLHRFCGNEQPSSVMSTGNAFYVKYVTAVDTPQAGFKSKISVAICGGTISSFNGVIKSPNYPNDYGNSQECEWLLKMPLGYRITLSLSDFETPRPMPGLNCTSTDYLEIRDYDEQGEVLRIFCGNLGNSSRTIDVPSSQAYVKFKSNYGVTGKGFSMWMQGNFDEGCGGWIEGSTDGIITSPNFPSPLQATRNCRWRLIAPEGMKMKLTFTEFNLPKDESSGICLSYIKAFNSSSWRQENSNKEICGNTLPHPIVSSSGSIQVVLFTHGLTAGQGFSLLYNSEMDDSVCGGLLTSHSGVISTPPNITVQNSTLDCKWRIINEGPENRTLVFRFPVFDVPGILANYCLNGVVYITGGNTYLGRFCGNYTSEVVFTSPFSTNSLKFFVVLNKPLRGIQGSYNYSDCGGLLYGEVDFSSPGYPSSYQPNTICHWIIYAEEGDTVTLNFVDLRLEEDCEKDYVIVRNGLRYYSPVVGHFCGTHAPAPITSSGSELTVIFRTDAFGSAPGFRITTREQQRGCGGLIHNHKGNLTSPNHPSHYDNNVECRWVIEYPPGYMVKLEFTGRFDLEMDRSCEKDYLLLEEFVENSSDWSPIAKKCGSETPSPVVSRSRKMRITFHSNDRITGDGFYINYTAACGGNFTNLHGEIFSPNYPSFYDNLLRCVYNIGLENQYVSLTFDDYFSIEGNEDCRYDYIYISDRNTINSTGLGPYCGTERPAPRTLEGPVTIDFVTDETFIAHGFKLSYDILACGAIMADPAGTIATPKTPNSFLNEMDCTWQIRAPPNKVIALRFLVFDINLNYRCWYDYLEIRDGNENGTVIGKLCGNSNPVVKSTGEILTLKLHMSSRSSSKGFTAFYHTTYGTKQGCGGTLYANNGSFQSLDADSDGFYEPNLDCRWLIIGDNDDLVYKVTFQRFDLEPSPNTTCIYDFVELREDISVDSALIGRYCGSSLPSPIITSGSKLSVIFHSDQKNKHPGFKLNFESVPSPCGPSVLTAIPGVPQTLKSPNYPNAYPPNLRCKWNILGNSTGNEWRLMTIQLTFTDLDVPCNGDYVEVKKIRTGMRVFPGHVIQKPIRLCGPTHAHDIIAQSGMTLTFQSVSNSVAAHGFSITYADASCNRTYTRDSGVLASSGYPGRRNSDTKCSMKITVSPEKTISAYFSRLEMYDALSDCPSNNIKVYDGADSSAPLIGTYCGFEAPNPVFSSGSSLYFESQMQHKMGLFYLIYMATDQDKGCGGRIYAEEGSLSSPLYPQTYKRDADCVWYLSVPGYHSMNIVFKTLILNSTSGCESNYVELYDGHSGSVADRVARYCGSDNPGTHVSRSNEVMVKFKSDTMNHGPGFLLNFQSNNYLPDTSLPFIQLHPESEVENFLSADAIYL